MKIKIGLFLLSVSTLNANELLVFRLKGLDQRQHAAQALKNLGLNVNLKRNDFGLNNLRVAEIKRLSKSKVDLEGIYSVKLPQALAPDLLAKIKKIPGFDAVVKTDMPPPVFVGDPEIQNEWWIDKINAREAWNIELAPEKLVSGSGVTIADCDSGYYTEESDIKGNLLLDLAKDLADLQNPLKIDDGGFVYHGTAVTAIMSGVRDSQGTHGIAYNSKVVPLQNFNYDGSLDDMGKEEATAECILHAITIPEVKIVVLENQTHGSSETFLGTREAVRLALEAGVTIVSAGGNSSNELTEEAADDTGSIIVGALAQTDTTANFSNYGSRVSIAAYGENLRTLYGPNGAFGSFGGTSGATPQVAGAVALMLEANPHLTPAQVKEVLVETRVNNEAYANVGGKLNVAAAVRRAIELNVPTDDGIPLAPNANIRAQLRNVILP